MGVGGRGNGEGGDGEGGDGEGGDGEVLGLNSCIVALFMKS